MFTPPGGATDVEKMVNFTVRFFSCMQRRLNVKKYLSCLTCSLRAISRYTWVYKICGLLSAQVKSFGHSYNISRARLLLLCYQMMYENWRAPFFFWTLYTPVFHAAFKTPVLSLLVLLFFCSSSRAPEENAPGALSFLLLDLSLEQGKESQWGEIKNRGKWRRKEIREREKVKIIRERDRGRRDCEEKR